MGYTQPSEIQSQAIPLSYREEMSLDSLKLGTGKTAAFASIIDLGRSDLESATSYHSCAYSLKLAVQETR